MAARIRKDDMVVVIAGDHKGARGKVLRVIPEKQRVLVEGVNMVYRHVRKSQRFSLSLAHPKAIWRRTVSFCNQTGRMASP